MKEKLSKEQSKKLLDLGIDPKLASEELIESISQQYYNEPRPKIFTYFDLRKLLPPEIIQDGQVYPLIITYGCDVPGNDHDLWFAYYDDLMLEDFINEDLNSYPCAVEEIDAVYDLVLWCIKKGLIKV